MWESNWNDLTKKTENLKHWSVLGTNFVKNQVELAIWRNWSNKKRESKKNKTRSENKSKSNNKAEIKQNEIKLN